MEKTTFDAEVILCKCFTFVELLSSVKIIYQRSAMARREFCGRE